MSNNQMISTAADRVRSLSDSIAQGLEVGQRYVALLNQLTSTKDPKELSAGRLLSAFNGADAGIKQ